MLGLSKREITKRFDEIVEFAELQDFIDAPVKTYSSGMYMRLGFAVAINVDPDVLLIDEVLAVGDQAFTAKCLDKFAEFRRRNKTILLVTHSLDLVEKFCDRALWLKQGKTLAEGEPKRVVATYLIDVEKAEEAQLARDEAAAAAHVSARRAACRQPSASRQPADVVSTPADMFQATEGRWGSREIEITEVTLLDAAGAPAHVFHSGARDGDSPAPRSHQPTSDFVFGIGLFNADGVCCYGTNTNIEELEPAEHQRRGRDALPDRTARPGRRHLQDRRRRAPARRLSLRLPSPALHLPGEVADAGTSASTVPTSLAVHAEHPLQAGRRPKK